MTTSSTLSVTDGLGRAVTLDRPPRTIASLVPSLTEALIAMDLDDTLIARTRYCIEPAARVEAIPALGGTKNPEIDRLIDLRPDLVVASAEENVREHVETLIEAGLTVYVSLPETVERAVAELAGLAALTGRERAAAPWLDDARATVARLETRARTRQPLPYFCPIWRRPYMVAAPGTYMSDLLRLCGGASVFGDGPARYYEVSLAEAAARRPDVILLPDEPYPFAAKHLPEIRAHAEMPAVRDGRVHLIDGQWITWYGPRIGPSLRAVAALFEAP